MKLTYVTPKISTLHLTIENEVAAGSATIRVVDSNDNILEEWETRDSTITIDW